MGGGVYDDGPSTFRYSCMSSGSFSNSNHSTDVPSLLSRLKQPPLASTNRKRKVAQDLPADRKCHKSEGSEARYSQAATAQVPQVVSGGKQDLSLHDYVECSLILHAVQ